MATDSTSLPGGGLLASVQNTVGIIETALAHHAAAQEALRAAIDIARTHGLSHLQGIIADNLGMSLAASGCADAGMQSINEAVKCDAVRADPSTLALGLCHTATVHRRLGHEAEAREYYRQALDALGERVDAYVTLNCAANLALVEGRSGRRDDGGLESIAASAKRAGVLFVAHKAILFKAVLLNQAGERHAATQALAGC
jgi:tetratricopeptide (TPR) repeat protein